MDVAARVVQKAKRLGDLRSESQKIEYMYILYTCGLVTTLEGGELRIGFSDRVWRDQPRGHPEVDPDTRGGITYTEK